MDADCKIEPTLLAADAGGALAVLDALDSGVVVVDAASATVLWANRAATPFLAALPADFFAPTCLGSGRPAGDPPAGEWSAVGNHFRREVEVDGRVFRATRSCLRQDGHLRCVAGFADITDNRRAQAELADQLSFLQTLIDAIPHPVYYKGLDGRYLGCNRAFTEKVTGLAPQDLRGRSVHDISPTPNAEVYHAADLALMRDGTTQVYEADVTSRDGHPRRFVFYKAVFRDTHGEPAGLVGSMLEVTELRRLSDRLNRLNLTLAGFDTDPLANIQTLLAFCGETLGATVTLFNRRQDSQLVTVAGWNLPDDYAAAIPAAGTLTDAVMASPGHEATLVRDLQRNFTSDPHAVRYVYATYLGQPVRIGVETVGAIAALYAGDCEPDENDRLFLGIVAAAIGSEEKRRQDLSALQRNFLDLAELNRRLQENQRQLVQSEKLASLGQLAAGVAHEINNPVGFVMSNLATLRDYIGSFRKILAADAALAAAAAGQEATAALAAVAADRRAEEDLDFILGDVEDLLRESLEGTERVREIVQNLKSFARPDEKGTRDVDLNACLESTLKVVWNELKYRCDVVKDFGELPPVTGRPGELNQVFMNLLVNAAHAIPERGTITITTRHDDEAVTVAVADTGVGMTPEVRDQIFEPFFTTKAAGKGTGLGLSISQAIVVKHGGAISVASEVGAGSTFTVRLPLAPA